MQACDKVQLASDSDGSRQSETTSILCKPRGSPISSSFAGIVRLSLPTAILIGISFHPSQSMSETRVSFVKRHAIVKRQVRPLRIQRSRATSRDCLALPRSSRQSLRCKVRPGGISDSPEHRMESIYDASPGYKGRSRSDKTTPTDKGCQERITAGSTEHLQASLSFYVCCKRFSSLSFLL